MDVMKRQERLRERLKQKSPHCFIEADLDIYERQQRRIMDVKEKLRRGITYLK